MQQDNKKKYTHYISSTRPVSYPIYIQWYLYVRNGFRTFFRKSILVGNHTMMWLRIRPSPKKISLLTTHTHHIDPLLLFEKPIMTRFLTLFPVSEPIQEEVVAVETIPTIDNNKTFRDYLSNVLIQWLFLPPLHQGGYVAKRTLSMEEVEALEQGKYQIQKTSIDPIWSSNIDKRFYDIDEFKEQMSDPKNTLELSWKSRIMYTSTPYGNVWMYYDAFKEGFAYYCDRMGLNYRLLNAIAMKYVMTYRCVDFFIDETVIKNNVSPFLVRLKEADSHDVMKKKKNIQYLLGDISNSPFVKNRPAPHANAPYVPTDVAQKITKNGTYESDKPTELYRNKFLYMGKICNASVLQTPMKKSSIQSHPDFHSNATMPIVSASSLYDATVNSQFNYKSFKETRMKQPM